MKKHEMINAVENYKHYLACKHQVKMPSTALLLLRKLIDHMNKDGFCFIKNETLMNYLQKSVRTIQNSTKFLEDHGFIIKVKRHRQNGSQKENGYQLRLDVLLNIPEEKSSPENIDANKSHSEIDWDYYQSDAYIYKGMQKST